MENGLKVFFGAFVLFAMFVGNFAVAVSDLTSITVCRGETVVFEFQLVNKVDPLAYDIYPQGLSGTLSINRVSLGRGEAVDFTFTVPTSDKALGNYPFTMVADGGPTVSRASALLIVVSCYDSALAANPSTLTVNACSQGKSILTLTNKGYKADTFTFTSTGDFGLTFSPAVRSLESGANTNSDATITVPCSASAGVPPIVVTANGVSKSSATINVNVVIPTPTPIPQGCQYNNPACPAPQLCVNNKCVMPPGCKYHNPDCTSGYVCDTDTNTCVPVGCAYNRPACTAPQLCVDNKCVMPPGCKYHNPDCPDGYVCDTAANLCKQVPKIPAPILTSNIQYDVCRGEKVVYDYELTNPTNTSQRYTISIEGMAGTVLPSSLLDVPANQAKKFSFSVDTSALGAKAYSFKVTAASPDKSVSTQSGLNISNCYASGLSLSTSSADLCPSQIKVRTITVRNLGSQADVFSLAAKDTGNFSVEFQPSALLIPAGETRNATLLITAPANPDNKVSSITRTISIVAASNSPSTTQMSLTVKQASDCPLVFDPSLYLSAVRACKNDTARLKFDLYNPSENDLIFNLTTNGVLGKLSRTEIPVKAKQVETFYYEIKTADMDFGRYPVEITATNAKATARVGSTLIVADCFGSNLTLVNIVGGGTIVPTIAPSPSASALPTAQATVQPSASPTAQASKNVIRVIGIEGDPLEDGKLSKMAVVIQNDAPYEISDVHIFLTNMTVISVKPPFTLSPGQRAVTELTVLTDRESPFSTNVRAVSEEGYGEAVLKVNATASKVFASVVRTTTQLVSNGTRENVTVTVRLTNNGKAAATYALSTKDSSVSVSPKNVTIPAGASAEIAFNTQLPAGKEYNATLIAVSKDGTYYLPVTLNTKTGGALTGLFSGSLASAAALALVTVAVVFVLLYLAKTQGPKGDTEEEADEELEEEKSEGANAKKKKKA